MTDFERTEDVVVNRLATQGFSNATERFMAKRWRWVMDLPNFADIHGEREFYDLVLNGEPERLSVRRVAAWPERPRHIGGAFLEGAGRAWRSGVGSRYPARRLEV